MSTLHIHWSPRRFQLKIEEHFVYLHSEMKGHESRVKIYTLSVSFPFPIQTKSVRLSLYLY